MKEWIRQLCAAPGPAGEEQRVAEVIGEWVRPYVSEVRRDALGNVIALKRPRVTDSGKTIVLSAHMDEPGVVALTQDDAGFIRIAPRGRDVEARTLPGRFVRFVRSGRLGVIGVDAGVQGDAEFRQLYVDAGARDAQSAQEAAQTGDTATFVGPAEELPGGLFCAPNLDDRLGCAVLLETLRLADSPHTVAAVFAAQSEVGSRGAQAAAFGFAPALALVVDLTGAGDTPGSSRLPLSVGGGPAVKAQDATIVVLQSVRDRIAAAAVAAGVTLQIEASGKAHSDAGAFFQAGRGTPAGGISIPCRYPGIGAQVASLADAQGAVDVLLALLGQPL